MLRLYHSLTMFSSPALRAALKIRLSRGKEHPERIRERLGKAAMPRPEGRLVWVHAASVGEAQSAMILITALLKMNPALNILVTTGTVTSAALMQRRLPQQAKHQFYPLDHPRWVKRFLEHWSPDLILWMESELWPNMLREIQDRSIRTILVNARMSPRSFQRWKRTGNVMARMLKTFDVVLAQTDADADAYRTLGALDVRVRDNIKYSAAPLPCDPADLQALKHAIGLRPVWLYASTHAGEEVLATDLHKSLISEFPDLLTIIVPRHPERRDDIAKICARTGLAARLRGESKTLPQDTDSIYIADTMGELGLFYRFARIACIGRTFSEDGGGGHNPIEAAQQDCAILHGPATQNLSDIFDVMDAAGAARRVETPEDFLNALRLLLGNAASLEELQSAGTRFAAAKSSVLDNILTDLKPYLTDSGVTTEA